MEDRSDYMDRYQLSVEILSSLRELDARIDALKFVLGDGPCPGQPERRQKLVDKIQAHIETRFCLVYSFLDLNPEEFKNKESLNPFDHFKVGYEELKRQIPGR